jgi:hypothetical protein
MRVRNWFKTVPALVIIGSILFLVLTVGGGLLTWGSNFSHNMVHDQLTQQNITFPPAGSEGLSAKEFPGLQQYGGQAVDNGPKAKAYANEFIAAHLKAAGGGMTYSEASAASRAKPEDAKLAASVQTLFRGETLRGLLLYAWGWSVVGTIAGYAGIAAFFGAAAVLMALMLGFAAHEREQKKAKVSATVKVATITNGRVPVSV